MIRDDQEDMWNPTINIIELRSYLCNFEKNIKETLDDVDKNKKALDTIIKENRCCKTCIYKNCVITCKIRYEGSDIWIYERWNNDIRKYCYSNEYNLWKSMIENK